MSPTAYQILDEPLQEVGDEAEKAIERLGWDFEKTSVEGKSLGEQLKRILK